MSNKSLPSVRHPDYYVQSTNAIIKRCSIYGMEDYFKDVLSTDTSHRKDVDFELSQIVGWYKYDTSMLVDIELIKNDNGFTFDVYSYYFNRELKNRVESVFASNLEKMYKLFSGKGMIGIKTLFDLNRMSFVETDDFTNKERIPIDKYLDGKLLLCIKEFPAFAVIGDSVLFVESSKRTYSEFCAITGMLALHSVLPESKHTLPSSAYGATLLSIVSGILNCDNGDELVDALKKDVDSNNAGPLEYFLYRFRNISLLPNLRMLDGIKSDKFKQILSEQIVDVDSSIEISPGLDDKAVLDIIAINGGKVLMSSVINMGVGKLVKIIHPKDIIHVELDISIGEVKRAYFQHMAMFVAFDNPTAEKLNKLREDLEFDEIYFCRNSDSKGESK